MAESLFGFCSSSTPSGSVLLVCGLHFENPKINKEAERKRRQVEVTSLGGPTNSSSDTMQVTVNIAPLELKNSAVEDEERNEEEDNNDGCLNLGTDVDLYEAVSCDDNSHSTEQRESFRG